MTQENSETAVTTSTGLTVAQKMAPEHLQHGQRRGNEEVSADSLATPRMKLLQKMSPEVDVHDQDRYVPGAQPGMFINSVNNELYGEEVTVINLLFNKTYNVWRKRNVSGDSLFVGAFESYPAANDALQAHVAETGDNPDDYEISETHSHLLIIADEEKGLSNTPILMDFAKSKVPVSRNWNTKIAERGDFDRFATVWRLKAKVVKNAKGDAFHNLEANYIGFASEEVFKKAESIYTAVKGTFTKSANLEG